MPGRAESAPPTAKAIRRKLLRLARVWNAPTVRTLTVEQRPSLRTTLGRYRPGSRTIELSPRAWASPEWPEILTHEAAHAAAAASPEGAGQPPHGQEWRRLMTQAGYPEARGTRWRGCLPRPSFSTPGEPKPASARYLHTCNVCDFHRTARRIARQLRQALSRLASEDVPADVSTSLTTRYESIRDAGALFGALLDHHEVAQREKPPDGKRPWVERSKRDEVYVRPQYRQPFDTDGRAPYVHNYRTPTCSRFLADLGRLGR